jgi:hypothetical protein
MDFNQMAFSIEKVTVTAKSRALKAEYSLELAQDLRAIHGLNAEAELANILSTEILAEINREVIRTIYKSAESGAQANVATAGTFDLDVDSNGRWSVEKFKGLIFQIERDANAIAQRTRRGKGNMILCSADVASALTMAGVLDYTPALNANLNVDDTGNTFAGVLQGKYRVYIDPYSANVAANQYYVVGYKGSSPYDAGLFYCPYVPLQMVRAVGENTFQPKIGFKTRYGIVANPFANAGAASGLLPITVFNSTRTATTEEFAFSTSCDSFSLQEFIRGTSKRDPFFYLNKNKIKWLDSFPNQIDNRNFLSPIGFKLSLSTKEKVDFFSNSANVPSISLGTALQGTTFRILDVPGDEVTYEDFTISFLVDEDLKNYMILHNWITGLGIPENFTQFKNLTTNEDGLKDDKLQFCDGTLHILNSNYRDIAMVKFIDLFPVSLTSLEFNATENDVNYFTAEASFKYTIYNILDPDGNPL